MDAVAELVRKAGCKLTICPQTENRNDRWIQVPGPPGGPQPDTVLEGEAGLFQRGMLLGSIQEDRGLRSSSPRQ